MPDDNHINKKTIDVCRDQVACPVCANGNFISLFKKNGEPFVKCMECGLVLINPRPVHDLISETYDDDYSQVYANKAEKKLRRIRRWVKRITKKHKPGGRWLDVGCSIGLVVKVAEEFGFEGYGVDVQSWGIDYGRQQLGLRRLVCGALEDQHYPDNHFDVISLYDVIEHVPDLNRLTTELKRILAPDGIIDIITPDIGHWKVPRILQDWSEIKPSEHLYYFNRHTLAELLQRHGLKIIKKRISLKPSLKVYAAHTG